MYKPKDNHTSID